MNIQKPCKFSVSCVRAVSKEISLHCNQFHEVKYPNLKLGALLEIFVSTSEICLSFEEKIELLIGSKASGLGGSDQITLTRRRGVSQD